MTVQNFAEFRLDDPQVCNFLVTQAARLEYQPAIAETLLQDGYEMKLPEYVGISNTEEDINLCYYKKTTWQAFEKPPSRRPRGKFDSFQTFKAECKFRIILQMYIAPGLDDATINVIGSIFYSIDMNRLSNEGMVYVNELVQDAETQGAGIDTYHAILSFQLARKDKDTKLSDSLVALKKEMDLDYDLSKIDEKIECGVPNLGFDGSEIVVDDISDTDIIETKIEEEIEKEASKLDCSELEYRKHRVGTLFQYPEFKTVWQKKRIKVGKCTFATIYYPQFFTRTRKNVLYASTAIPKSVIAAMEKGAIECLVLSATSTALLAIITGGVAVPVAAKVFISAFTNCIKIKFGNVVRCIVPKISVVVEKSDWGAV